MANEGVHNPVPDCRFKMRKLTLRYLHPHRVNMRIIKELIKSHNTIKIKRWFP